MPDPITPAVATPADPNSIQFPASSNLNSAVLDPATGIVSVSFANGATAQYKKFTVDAMKDWAAAKSAGTWFHQNVRQHPEKYPQLGAEAPAPAETAPSVPDVAPVADAPAPAPAPRQPGKKRYWEEKGFPGYGNGATTPADKS